MVKMQPKEEKERLGDTIRLLRVKAGMSPLQLAEAVGVSAEAIAHYEDNTWSPGTMILARLAGALDVSLTELINGCSLLYDEDGKILLVRHTGHNQIKVIGTITEHLSHRKDVE